VVRAADDVARAGRQLQLARVDDQRERAAVLDRAVGDGQVVALQVGQRVAGRAAFRVADGARGDAVAPEGPEVFGGVRKRTSLSP
jgi:hypothetical protein